MLVRVKESRNSYYVCNTFDLISKSSHVAHTCVIFRWQGSDVCACEGIN